MPFVARKIAVADGSVLVLCTDGLLKGCGEDVSDLLAALRETSIDPAQHPVETCGAVVRDFPHRQRDDVALLVARLQGIPQADVATFRVPLNPSRVRVARHEVRAQLAQWGLAELSFTAELLVGELVTNALRVARAPVGLQLVRTDRLLVEVSDDDHVLPVLEDHPLAEQGRGLLLVSRIADRWGTARRAVGKVVWFELAIGRN